MSDLICINPWCRNMPMTGGNYCAACEATLTAMRYDAATSDTQPGTAADRLARDLVGLVFDTTGNEDPRIILRRQQHTLTGYADLVEQMNDEIASLNRALDYANAELKHKGEQCEALGEQLMAYVEAERCGPELIRLDRQQSGGIFARLRRLFRGH